MVKDKNGSMNFQGKQILIALLIFLIVFAGLAYFIHNMVKQKEYQSTARETRKHINKCVSDCSYVGEVFSKVWINEAKDKIEFSDWMRRARNKFTDFDELAEQKAEAESYISKLNSLGESDSAVHDKIEDYYKAYSQLYSLTMYPSENYYDFANRKKHIEQEIFEISNELDTLMN